MPDNAEQGMSHQTHNLKVAGSNPAPATKNKKRPNPNRLWAFLFARLPAEKRQGKTYGKQVEARTAKVLHGKPAKPCRFDALMEKAAAYASSNKLIGIQDVGMVTAYFVMDYAKLIIGETI